MKTFKKTADLVDPIGPGSPAWHQADLAADHFASGNRAAFFCAQTRMISELRKAGVSDFDIDAWKRDIRESPVEFL